VKIWQNVIVSSIMLLVLNTIGILFGSISSIMALVGATVQLYLVFVIPILVYLKTTNNIENSKLRVLGLQINYLRMNQSNGNKMKC